MGRTRPRPDCQPAASGPSRPRAALLRDQPRRALRILIGYNPQAGRFSVDRLNRLRDSLIAAGHRVELADSLTLAGRGSAMEADITCLFGGDGTARDVIGRHDIHRSRTRFAVYPAGTVNLIAREARYPDDPRAFARRLTGPGPAPRHYGGRIGRELFLCCASVGPDSAAVARVSPRLKRAGGRLAYVAALAGLLWRWPRHPLEVTIDGEPFRAEAAYVCKGRYFAGPWTLDPAASLASDTFRVLLLPTARRRDILRLALSAMVSPRLGDPGWIRRPGRRVTVDAAVPLPLQADGDHVAQTPALIEIAPDPLPFA